MTCRLIDFRDLVALKDGRKRFALSWRMILRWAHDSWPRPSVGADDKRALGSSAARW